MRPNPLGLDSSKLPRSMQGLCLENLVVGSAAPRVLPRDRLEICWLCDMRLSHWETVILFKIEDWLHAARSLTLVYTYLASRHPNQRDPPDISPATCSSSKRARIIALSHSTASLVFRVCKSSTFYCFYSSHSARYRTFNESHLMGDTSEAVITALRVTDSNLSSNATRRSADATA